MKYPPELEQIRDLLRQVEKTARKNGYREVAHLAGVTRLAAELPHPFPPACRHRRLQA